MVVDIDAKRLAAGRANHPEQTEALLAVLRSVDDGEISADGPASAALAQQLRGALSALSTWLPIQKPTAPQHD